MGLDRNSIPDTYLCEKCEPRKVDRHKAKALQIRKKEEMTGAQSKKQERSRSRSGQSRTNKKVKVNSEGAEAEIKLRRRSKSKSGNTSTADEEEQDAWVIHRNLKEWIDNFEEAVTNQYTPEVQLLAGVMRVDNELVSEQLQAQLCKVAEVSKTQRCLVSAQHIKKEQVIVEYKGRFLTLSQFHGQHPVFRSRVFPFVLFHKPHEDEEGICVDAREYGNIARFIRRSCTPNAEVRHVILNGLLHLYIFSRKDIKKEQEITIPFDFASDD
ncbi:histone-lysine N-methyltransferase 2E-like, partial [Limulus polyphemus]|uniref:Histone-lysine N-methyltransferase 2E-like n=1 Tax=Limulus polyphemus TaxID=6850 RepID=A0ABM1C1Z5_LIMPO